MESGYWQLEMHNEDKEHVAFFANTGLRPFTAVPSGLLNSPSTFGRLMERVLRGSLKRIV